MNGILYKSIVHTTLDAFLIFDMAGNIIECNDCAQAMYGYGREELLAMSVHDIEAIEDPTEVKHHQEKLFKVGYDRFETRHFRKDNKIIDVEVSSTFVPEIQQILTLCRDITAQKGALIDLKQANERLDAMMNALPDLMFRLGQDGTIYEFRSSVPQLLYISPDKFIDKRIAEVLPEEPARIIMAALEKAAENGICHGEVYALPMPQGTKWYECSIAAIAGGGLNDSQFIMLARDITDRMLAEQGMRESGEKFRSIVETSQDWIWEMGLAGVHTFSNARVLDILGYSTDDFLHLDLLELVHQEDRQEVLRRLPQLIAEKRGWRGWVLRWRHKNGSYRFLESNANPILTESGALAGFRGVDRDITERKTAEDERLHLEQQILHAQKLESLGVLAGGIAHDFNNILTSIVGNTELALLHLPAETPAKDNLLRVEKAAMRATDLAKQMLAYSGRGKFVIENIDLNRLIDEMGRMLEVSISKKVTLRYNLTKRIPLVHGDVTQIRQVLMNLVINAAEAIGDADGVVAISTGSVTCDSQYLKEIWTIEQLTGGLYAFIEVADTGCGMSSEVITKLFDPFFTTKFTGRGLGMAAVLGIVRGHHGAIKLTSNVGQGSTFQILLPASSEEEVKPLEQEPPIEWHGTGTVLLVDDEDTVLDIGREMLRNIGYEVVTATNGLEALDVFSSRMDISLVILDLTMPQMDGIQCFKSLKAIKPDLKVIISSGFNEQEVTKQREVQGLAGFIQKPYRLADLKAMLKTI